MAADETSGAGDADDDACDNGGADGAACDDPGRRALLERARHNCRRLLDELGRDARILAAHRPSAPAPQGVLDEGRAACARAAAAAEALLQRLDESLADAQ